MNCMCPQEKQVHQRNELVDELDRDRIDIESVSNS